MLLAAPCQRSEPQLPTCGQGELGFEELCHEGRPPSSQAAPFLPHPTASQAAPFLPRPPSRLSSELPFFTVLERESKVLGCAAVKPLGCNAEGAEVAELSAFCVHPAYRGGGKGDSLLEYLGAFWAGVPGWHGCC